MLCHWTIMTKRPNCATLNDRRLFFSLHTNPSQETNTGNKQCLTSSFNYKDNTLHGLKGRWHQTMLRLLPCKIYFNYSPHAAPGPWLSQGQMKAQFAAPQKSVSYCRSPTGRRNFLLCCYPREEQTKQVGRFYLKKGVIWKEVINK